MGHRRLLTIAALLVLWLAACNPPTAATPTPSTTTSPPRPSSTITASPTPTPTPTPTPSPTPTPATTGYTSPRGTITVEQPRAFAVVTSPLAVSGTASLFEGGFSWKLVDLAGKELAKGTGQASPGAPARGTFSFSVSFTVTADTYAYLSLVSFSARDGSVDDEARVPLILTVR